MNQPTLPPKAEPKFRFRRVLVLCGVLYLMACVGCASCQRRLIYFPPITSQTEAEAAGRSEGLERWLSSAGKPLGWKRLSSTQPAIGQILVTHGNACCAFQCGHYADAIQQAAALDVFILEYPGYADRAGKPSEQTLDEAAEESLLQLSTNTPIYLVGESLGTGVAAYLAGRLPERITGAALLAPYTCLADVGQSHMWILPVHLLLCDRYPAEDYLRGFHSPLAVAVGGRDSVVPERFGRRLFHAYSGPKRLWSFPGADHGNLMYQPSEFWGQVVTFWTASENR